MNDPGMVWSRRVQAVQTIADGGEILDLLRTGWSAGKIRQRGERGGVDVVRVLIVGRDLGAGPCGDPVAVALVFRSIERGGGCEECAFEVAARRHSRQSLRRCVSARGLVLARLTGPERMEIRDGDTPLRHHAIRVARGGMVEQALRLDVHHVVQQVQPFVEGGIGFRRAGGREIDPVRERRSGQHGRHQARGKSGNGSAGWIWHVLELPRKLKIASRFVVHG